MQQFATLICFYCICYITVAFRSISGSESMENPPTILIATLVRNKASSLPYFLTYLQNQNYPKERLALWIRADHNLDNSVKLLQLWLNETKEMYHDVSFQFEEDPKFYKNESSATDWPLERFLKIIKLKEEALAYARKIWADFIFFLDADAFLTNPDALSHLVNLRLPITAPMLLSEGLYSNYWCGMTLDYYYHRTDEYKEIYNHKKYGQFSVPMVHSAVLINLNYVNSKWLTFDRHQLIEYEKQNMLDANCSIYNGPLDDIIIFAISANCSNVPMYVSNSILYGYILQPLESSEALEREQQLLMNIKLNIISDGSGQISVNNIFMEHIIYPEKQTLTLDRIYMINLERRSERRIKMNNSFNELGLEVEYFPAVDGKQLNLQNLTNMGIKFLEGYEDPYHHRQMTMGEVGCFLSHYRIWEKMLEKNLKEVLILEDDIRFEPYFQEKAISILEQARNIGPFDLIYFGRKRLEDQVEEWVGGSENLVHVGYSYWTLAYVITLEGARKLINVKPLEKLIPVDEFLPIMFNRHPNDSWSAGFWPRDLKAYSAAPLLLYPTHYTGDDGYISDTEDSEITTQKLLDTKAQYKSDRESFKSGTNSPEIMSLKPSNNEKHDSGEL